MPSRRRDSRSKLVLALLCSCLLIYGASSFLSGSGLRREITLSPQAVSPTPVHKETFSCTLVVHTTMDRLWGLSAILERWKGPLALAVLFALNTSRETVVKTTGHLPSRVSIINVIHKGGEYPINILRNMAIKLVNTSHYMMLDVDLVPSVDLEQLILNEAMSKWLKSPRTALIVPVFEPLPPEPCTLTSLECLSLVPSTFQQLSVCVREHKCQAVGNSSQTPTDNARWLAWNSSQRSYPLLCVESPQYEPFVVLANSPDTPRYNERFVGYGADKTQYITHLRFLNFNFRVLVGGFLFHQPHKASTFKESFRTDSATHKRVEDLFQEFKVSLERKFVQPNVPLCASRVRLPKEDGDEPLV